MTHEITFQYKDGQVLNITIESEKVDAFLESLHEKRMFWLGEKDKGFWTNLNDIRFVRANIKIEKVLDEVVV